MNESHSRGAIFPTTWEAALESAWRAASNVNHRTSVFRGPDGWTWEFTA